PAATGAAGSAAFLPRPHRNPDPGHRRCRRPPGAAPAFAGKQRTDPFPRDHGRRTTYPGGGRRMKTATTICPAAPPLVRTRLADYVELTKPRVAVLVLFTVAVGALLAAGGSLSLAILLHTLAGTALVAGGASALNQFLERHSDAHMVRTESRPLPAGRLHPPEVFAFGLALGVTGVCYLAFALPRPWAALVAAVTFVSYVFLYTPLKRKTTLNTLVGAVPGALPPVIGWAAAG